MMKTFYRLLLMLMAIATVTMHATAASRLYIEDFSVEPGTTATVPLLLDNPDEPLAAFQLDIYMPQGLTLAQDGVRLAERATGSHQLMTKINGDHLTVMVFSFPATDFSGSSGAVVYLDVAAADNFAGQAVINVKNVALTTSDAHEVSHPDFAVTVTAAGFVVLGNEFYMDDFSIKPGTSQTVPIVMDNKASAVAGFQFDMYLPADITATATSFTLSDRKGESHQLVANKNGDHWSVVAFGFPTSDFAGDEGDIMYVNLTASKTLTGSAEIQFRNIVLSTSDPRECPIDDFTVNVTADGEYVAGDNLTISDFEIAPGRSKLVPVLLTNETVEVNAVEFDLVIPEHLTVSNQVRPGERAVGHLVTTSQQGNVLHVVESSNPAVNFLGDDGNIMYLKVKADRQFTGSTIINVQNVVLKTDGGNITIDDFAVVVTASGSYIPNDTLYIDDFSIEQGGTLSIPVIMDNEVTNIAAVQFDISMPAEISILQDENSGNYSISLTNRKSDNHHIIASLKSDGDINVVAVSFPPTDFAGNSGAIMNIDMQALAGFTGITHLNVKNVVMTTADALTEISAPDFEVMVSVVNGGNHIVGDVNCDGHVTSADITALFNYLLSNDETFIATSDVNGDGSVTSADVTAVYSIIMSN